jgi:glycosyltransferase involved in cell wall biosynthesis
MISISSDAVPVRRALVGYLPDALSLPTNHPNFFGHSNYQEARTLVEILVSFGYSCDVVDWTADVSDLAGSAYDLFVGVGPQLVNARSLVHSRGTTIFYAGHAYWRVTNAAELGRLAQLRRRRGITLQPRRQMLPDALAGQIDEIWYLGNDFQRATYDHLGVPQHRLSISTVEAAALPRSRTGSQGRGRAFLWFGSRGAVHKGLDWVLEIFARNPDLQLHVCGLVDQEADFTASYASELRETSNISFHGWVLPSEERFGTICDQCAFVIAPSASEGGGGATLQCMRTGLIPIVTPGAAVDVEVAGLLVTDELEALEAGVRQASSVSDDAVDVAAGRVRRHIEVAHTLNSYCESVRARVSELEQR